MESLTYGKLFNQYCADYSSGRRSFEDLLEAISRLNVRYELDNAWRAE